MAVKNFFCIVFQQLEECLELILSINICKMGKKITND